MNKNVLAKLILGALLTVGTISTLKASDSKCASGKCGTKKETKASKCGAGKCGSKKENNSSKCGAGKCGAGKCGAKK